jgi:uncharacterized membrane protein/sporulation protein YlmC with PRC-barrel domain
MDIPLHAKVECADGPCGESTLVIVNPVTGKLTHLVVRGRHGQEYLVPVGQVQDTTHDLIRLQCTTDELNHMEPFVETEYVEGDQALPMMYPIYDDMMMAPYAVPIDLSALPVEVERIPPGEVAVRRGTRVDATDGHVGTVGELVVDESGEYITHFVLQEGHWWDKKEVTLPLSSIDRVEADTVYLKLDKQAIEKLPAIPLKRSYVEGKANIELVARVFDDTEKAGQALDFVEDLRNRRVIKILNAAVLVKDQEGQVSVKDTKEIDPKKGRILGVITGGLVGLLGGPVGVVVGALAGLGVGGAAGKRIDEGFSDKFLKNLEQYLKPGTSALILLMEDQWVRKASEAMADLEGVVIQQTLTDKLVEDLLGASEPDA